MAGMSRHCFVVLATYVCAHDSCTSLAGTLPASLGSQPSLIRVDVSANKLTGEIAPFAAELADGSQRLAHLNLSNNYISGPLPQVSSHRTRPSTQPPTPRTLPCVHAHCNP
jgi:hypothetical protein